jgi:hypothetical protein
MTITITREQMYIGIIVFLLILQIYQQGQIKKLQQDTSDLWSQLGTLIANLSNQMLQIQKDINSKQDKNPSK